LMERNEDATRPEKDGEKRRRIRTSRDRVKRPRFKQFASQEKTIETARVIKKKRKLLNKKRANSGETPGPGDRE